MLIRVRSSLLPVNTTYGGRGRVVYVYLSCVSEPNFDQARIVTVTFVPTLSILSFCGGAGGFGEESSPVIWAMSSLVVESVIQCASRDGLKTGENYRLYTLLFSDWIAHCGVHRHVLWLRLVQVQKETPHIIATQIIRT